MRPAHTFCVDGTNFVRRTCGYGGPQFQPQEDADSERLVSALADFCERLGAQVEVDLVFDGADRPRLRGPGGKPGNLRVRFAREDPADELILDRVRALRHARSKVTVVTADQELATRVSEEGARLVAVNPRCDPAGLIRSLERRAA